MILNATIFMYSTMVLQRIPWYYKVTHILIFFFNFDIFLQMQICLKIFFSLSQIS